MVCKAGPLQKDAKYATSTIYRPPRPHVGLLFDSRAVEGRGMTRDGFLDLEIPGSGLRPAVFARREGEACKSGETGVKKGLCVCDARSGQVHRGLPEFIPKIGGELEVLCNGPIRISKCRIFCALPSWLQRQSYRRLDVQFTTAAL